jgi:hypothetical protein
LSGRCLGTQEGDALVGVVSNDRRAHVCQRHKFDDAEELPSWVEKPSGRSDDAEELPPWVEKPSGRSDAGDQGAHRSASSKQQKEEFPPLIYIRCYYPVAAWILLPALVHNFWYTCPGNASAWAEAP